MRQKAWIIHQRGSGPGKSKVGCILQFLNSLPEIPYWDSPVRLVSPCLPFLDIPLRRPTCLALIILAQSCTTKEWSWLSLKPQLLPAGQVSWGSALPYARGVYSSSCNVRLRQTHCSVIPRFSFMPHPLWPLHLAVLTTLLGFKDLVFGLCSSLINSFLGMLPPRGREPCDKVLSVRALVLHHSSS